MSHIENRTTKFLKKWGLPLFIFLSIFLMMATSKTEAICDKLKVEEFVYSCTKSGGEMSGCKAYAQKYHCRFKALYQNW